MYEKLIEYIVWSHMSIRPNDRAGSPHDVRSRRRDSVAGGWYCECYIGEWRQHPLTWL